MIVELVEFRVPPGWTREQILEDARHTVAKWRADPDLVRKHYLVGENGMAGAFYIWPSREAAERGHDAAWRAGVEKRTGSQPSIRYFDLMMIVDNAAGATTEYPPGATRI
ncbi:MAG: monooxygenase [Beijerinckiaceae bacterium]